MPAKENNKKEIKLVKSLLLTTFIAEDIFFGKSISLRESECLLLAEKGKRVEESAKLMNVKASTVKTWRNNILDKLTCRSMAHAVFTGIQHGYLYPDLETEKSYNFLRKIIRDYYGRKRTKKTPIDRYLILHLHHHYFQKFESTSAQNNFQHLSTEE